MYVVTIILIIYITIFIGFHPTSSARADDEVAVAWATTCWELCSIGPYRVDVVAVQTVSAVGAVVFDVKAAAVTPFNTIGVTALAAFFAPSLECQVNGWDVLHRYVCCRCHVRCVLLVLHHVLHRVRRRVRVHRGRRWPDSNVCNFRAFLGAGRTPMVLSLR